MSGGKIVRNRSLDTIKTDTGFVVDPNISRKDSLARALDQDTQKVTKGAKRGKGGMSPAELKAYHEYKAYMARKERERLNARSKNDPNVNNDKRSEARMNLDDTEKYHKDKSRKLGGRG